MTADPELRATIAGLELFRGLPEEVLAGVAAGARFATFREGDALMRQGEPPDSVHVLLSGQVGVTLQHPRREEPVLVAVLGPGEIVGEMGVLDNKPRSASVIALLDTTTVELTGLVGAGALLEQPEVAWRCCAR